MDIISTISEIALQGRFDAHETESFRELVDEILTSSADLRVILTDVEFIDSTALAELVRAMKHCREAGGELTLVKPSDPVRIILELTRLDTAFTIE